MVLFGESSPRSPHPQIRRVTAIPLHLFFLPLEKVPRGSTDTHPRCTDLRQSEREMPMPCLIGVGDGDGGATSIESAPPGEVNNFSTKKSFQKACPHNLLSLVPYYNKITALISNFSTHHLMNPLIK